MKINERKYATLFADFLTWTSCATHQDSDEYTIYCDINSIMLKQKTGYILFNQANEICAVRKDACFGKYFKADDYDAIEYWYQDIHNYMR